MPYPWEYTTSAIPTWDILILQVRQGHLAIQELGTNESTYCGNTHVSQYNMEPSLIRSRPASSSAFSSAWMHKQVRRPTPAGCPSLHRVPESTQHCVDSDVSRLHASKRTATLVAVFNVSRGPIVTCAYNSSFTNKDTANSSFHTIASLCCQRGQLHEVLIPIWSQTLNICQIQVP